MFSKTLVEVNFLALHYQESRTEGHFSDVTADFAHVLVGYNK